jgi:glycosyltransferase involved in cell wall biosynthesis
LEALAMARPVVATTMGVEALDVSSGHELIIADTAEAFAASTLALLRNADARRRLGAAGRDLVLRRYTWEACAASYDAIYSQLAARHGSSRRLTNLRDKAVSR